MMAGGEVGCGAAAAAPAATTAETGGLEVTAGAVPCSHLTQKTRGTERTCNTRAKLHAAKKHLDQCINR